MKINGALLCGALIALGTLQEDPWLKTRLERMLIQSMSSIVGQPFHLQLTHLDLLSGHVIMESVHSKAPDKSWSFTCPQIHAHISWLSYLRHGVCATELNFNKPVVFTLYENKKAAIEKPFLAVLSAPTELPIFITTCSSYNGLLTIESPSARGVFTLTSTTALGDQSIMTNIFCRDGSLALKGQEIAKALAGTASIDVPVAKPHAYLFKTHLGLELPLVQSSPHKKRSVFLGSYVQGKAQAIWYPEDRSLMLTADCDTLNTDQPEIDLEFSGALAALAEHFPLPSSLKALQGTADMSAKMKIAQTATYEGSGTINNCGIANTAVPQISLLFAGNEKEIKGSLAIPLSKKAQLSGTWNYALSEGELRVSSILTSPYQLFSKVKVESAGTKGSLRIKDGKASGAVLLAITYLESKKVRVKVSCESDSTRACCKGSVNDSPFEIACSFDPLQLEKLLFNDDYGKKWLSFEADTRETIAGTVHFDFIKEVVRALTGYQLSGQAVIAARTKLGPLGAELELKSSDAHIKLPAGHNVIKGFKAALSYDYPSKALTVKDCVIDLHKGSCTLTHGTVHLSSHNTLNFAHLPLQCSRLFVNWSKDFYGTLSGGLTMLLKEGRWLCQGSISLDKALLRSNLLSSKVQKDLLKTSTFAQDIDLVLRLATESPLQVKSPFFETEVAVAGLITGTVAKPLLAGRADLIHGSFGFPYKPLYITSGSLFMTPQQEPMVELTAKNSIKKYSVTMQVSGSLLQPKISFYSSPHLAEQNILTLLFAGSEEGSLYLAMPGMVMMQLEGLLFGSDEKLTKAQQFFKGLLKPLKNVRIMPDAEGKGLKGSIEVDINDRLRAKAQSNLNLTDEPQLELEYSVSDDMTIKAVRDETGSIGGELEMRWKF